MRYDVVIVDTGVNISHPKLSNYTIRSMQIQIDAIENEKLVYIDSKSDNDNVGHGTAISNIVLSHAPDVSLLVIKVFDSDLYIEEHLLFDVLEFILNNIDCRIVNLSLGISALENPNAMYNLCSRLNQKGAIIVSAFDNDGSMSFPASFDNVIGVTSNNYCTKNTDYLVLDDLRINVGAKGGQQRIAWLQGKFSIGIGNSYACAHVTGICINILRKNSQYSRKQLLEHLKKLQRQDFLKDETTTDKYKQIIINYRNVALFPFNKEMHALVRFSDMLPFKIVDIYDVKFSPNIGASTDQLLGINTTNPFIIKNINLLNWDEIDTIIIGHTRALFNNILKDTSILYSLLYKAIALGKNVFSFDNLPLEFNNVGDFISPPMHKVYIPIPYGKLYHISKPILAVFGTSSRQGKFSLQLILRKKFLERGYNIGQLGTEPSSFLFGMDECFHFGYDSELKLTRYDSISFLNSTLFNISKKNVDIIITGCQSETVITDEGNLAFYPLPQIEFLFGILPDAIILMINPYDDQRIIDRTIYFLESCVETKVIALVVFPMGDVTENTRTIKRHISKSDYIKIKNRIQKKIDIPVVLLDDDLEINRLIDIIEDYFS